VCLAVPGRVVSIDGDAELAMAVVDFGGVTRAASLVFVPETRVGDYVLVHVGFAIATVDEAQAEETLAALRALELDDPGVDGADDAPRR
jgi:hydrogenase expression/formation protein HypC